MLTITIISVSHKQPSWVIEAYEEYAKRFPARELILQFKELKPEPRASNSDSAVAQAMRAEAVKIQSVLQNLPKGTLILALDERGEAVSSVQLAQKLQYWQNEYSHVALIVGGADGLDPTFKAQCHGLLRLSNLTLPHGMVRVLLAEQLYRAYTININHPYHRV